MKCQEKQCQEKQRARQQNRQKFVCVRKGMVLRGVCRASMTVEAVFIIPLATMMIVLLIDMALYMRDLSVARALAERVAEDTRALILNDEEPRLHKVMYERKLERSIFERWFSDTASEDSDSMEDYLDELAEGRFWISRVDGRSIRAEDNCITVHIALKSDTEMPFFGKALTSRWFSDDITCRVNCEDIGMRTRIYSAVMETGMEIRGVNTILTKLSEIVNRLR